MDESCISRSRNENLAERDHFGDISLGGKAI
jgi:hypothetical protein